MIRHILNLNYLKHEILAYTFRYILKTIRIMKIMTESIHFTADQKLLQYIEHKLQKLERMYERIIDIHVVLKLESHQTIKDKIVEILIHVPGGNIFTRESSKSFETSLELAMASLKRQTLKFKEKISS